MNKEENKIREQKNIGLEESITSWVGSRSSLFVHTVLFLAAFALIVFGYQADRVLLVLTTIVSLEAIYLSIFIQMSVNRNTESLEEVEEDIDEIQEDVDEITEDIEDIQEDVDEISEDIEEIQDDIHEEIESMEDDDKEIKEKQDKTNNQLTELQNILTNVLKEIDELKKRG